jgi:acyl dehydratase
LSLSGSQPGEEGLAVALNLDAVGKVSEPVERSWTEKDVILYALGVGAGADDPTGDELAFTTENSDGVSLAVLPTFPVVLGGGGGIDLGTFDPAMLVHGEQEIELHGPLPAAGTVTVTMQLVGIYDKGSGALVVMENQGVDPATGKSRFTSRASAFIRGEGGFGGERSPSGSTPAPEVPDGGPDLTVTYPVRMDQALLYRLSGDRNPLHSDPVFAQRAGFDRPILHGLCTYGFTGRALLHGCCDSDPARFGSMAGRFSRPVWPGDTLTVKIWSVDAESGRYGFRTEGQSGEVVIDRGSFTTEAAS